MLAGFFVLLSGKHFYHLVDVSLNPSLNSLDATNVQVVEMKLFRCIVNFLVFFDFVDQTVPTQCQTDLKIRSKVSVFANTTDDVVLFNVRLQEIIWIRWVPFVFLHLRHEVHPSTRKSIVGVDIYRMYIHQATEVVCPCVETVERTVFVIWNDVPGICRRNYTTVVVFIQNTFYSNFFLSLLYLSAA